MAANDIQESPYITSWGVIPPSPTHSIEFEDSSPFDSYLKSPYDLLDEFGLDTLQASRSTRTSGVDYHPSGYDAPSQGTSLFMDQDFMPSHCSTSHTPADDQRPRESPFVDCSFDSRPSRDVKYRERRSGAPLPSPFPPSRLNTLRSFGDMSARRPMPQAHFIINTRKEFDAGEPPGGTQPPPALNIGNMSASRPMPPDHQLGIKTKRSNRSERAHGPLCPPARKWDPPSFSGSQLRHPSDNQLATSPAQSSTFFTANNVSISGGVFKFNVNPDPNISNSLRGSQEPVLSVSNKVLGTGSCGTVVFQGSFQGRAVAVKRLLRDFITLAEREVAILQHSDHHPNVIRYYYKEARENYLLIAIELCLASLADIIEKPNQDKWRHIVDFDPKSALGDITSGLDHLHNLNVVHRDLKPKNILISAQKTKLRNGQFGHRMLVSDFGLCKRLDDDQTSSTLAAGTRGWQAPEILRIKQERSLIKLTARETVDDAMPSSSSKNMLLAPRKLSKSMDIFPLGCLFYYTLTKGRHPYGGEFVREMNILKDVKDLLGVDRFGEEGLKAKDLITGMLNPEPNQRPDTTMCLEHPYFKE